VECRPGRSPSFVQADERALGDPRVRHPGTQVEAQGTVVVLEQLRFALKISAHRPEARGQIGEVTPYLGARRPQRVAELTLRPRGVLSPDPSGRRRATRLSRIVTGGASPRWNRSKAGAGIRYKRSEIWMAGSRPSWMSRRTVELLTPRIAATSA